LIIYLAAQRKDHLPVRRSLNFQHLSSLGTRTKRPGSNSFALPPELLCEIRAFTAWTLAKLIASGRGIRFVLIIVKLDLLFRIYPCGCSPSAFPECVRPEPGPFRRRSSRNAEFLLAFVARTCLEHTDFSNLDANRELFRISGLRAMKCRGFQ
jgi:hypothetical protein